jgi:ribosomal protein S18 acetylase RimI-like enzyme
MQGGTSMEIAEIKDREKVKNFFLQEPYLHLYELGNLQEKLFSRSSWHCALDDGKIKALAMLHIAPDEKNNVFFMLENTNIDASLFLMQGMKKHLPKSFYAHVSKEAGQRLLPDYEISRPVIYNKMKISGDMLLKNSIKYPEYTYRVNKNDFETINEFIKGINPDAFFTKAMLETGKYFIVRKNSDIISMAGVHFYSAETMTAAIGNVATAPEFRGKGYAGSVTASLVRDLWKEAKYIGLNVRADNAAAIKAYERMGFMFYSSHEEIRAKKP